MNPFSPTKPRYDTPTAGWVLGKHLVSVVALVCTLGIKLIDNTKVV